MSNSAENSKYMENSAKIPTSCVKNIEEGSSLGLRQKRPLATTLRERLALIFTGVLIVTVPLLANACSANAEVKPMVVPPTPSPLTEIQASTPAVLPTLVVYPTPTTIPPTPTATEAPKPTPVIEKLTQEQAVVKIGEIIEKIKNPDPKLVKEFQLDPIQLKRDINNLVWGADPDEPKSPISGGGFMPGSLKGIEETIKKGNNPLAQEQILAIFPRVANPIGSLAKPNPDAHNDVKQAVLNEVDPNFLFHQKDRIGLDISKVKEAAAFDLIKLIYGLTTPSK